MQSATEITCSLAGSSRGSQFYFFSVSASEFKLKCCQIKTYSAKVSPLVCALSYPQGSLCRTHVAPLTSSQIAIFRIGVDSAPLPFPLFSLDFYCISKVNFKQTFEVFALNYFYFLYFFKCKLLTSTERLHAIERGGSTKRFRHHYSAVVAANPLAHSRSVFNSIAASRKSIHGRFSSEFGVKVKHRELYGGEPSPNVSNLGALGAEH